MDAVLHNASQEAVYDNTARDIVSAALQGYNGTVFCYGQTGAGKTFTMTGGQESYKYRGLIPRALHHVFADIESRPESAVTVRVSYLEIYNENLRDLLTTLPDAEEAGGGGGLQVVNDPAAGTLVKGQVRPVANTEEEALNFLFEGETNRAVAKHTMNSQSSRSHCIFTVHLETRSRVESQEKIVRSKLHLVDLAGSERIKKTDSDGQIRSEAMHINKSLSFLEQVILALGAKGAAEAAAALEPGTPVAGGPQLHHIPFRQSKLTHVLRDSLGGNSMTVMVANVHVEKDHLEETASTLKFATRVMDVQTDAQINVENDPELLAKRYEREIRELRQELAMHDTLNNRSRVVYEPYSEEQRHEVAKTVRSYIRGDIDDIEVVNLRHIKEVFLQFRTICRNTEAEVQEQMRLAAANGGAAGAGGADGSGPGAGGDSARMRATEADGVGDLEPGGGGFAMGKAPASAKPKKGSAAAKLRGKSATPDSGAAPGSPLNQPPQHDDSAVADGAAAGDTALVNAAPPSRDEAFRTFGAREERGVAINKRLAEAKAEMKDLRTTTKAEANIINSAKMDIERLQATIDSKRTERRATSDYVDADADEVIDEEEFAVLQQLKAAKALSREHYSILNDVKARLAQVKFEVDSSRSELVAAFENWYRAMYGEEAEAALDDAPEDDEQLNGSGADEFMDDGERFDQLEKERIAQSDPASLAFHNAKRSAAARRKTGTGGPARAQFR